MSARQRSARSNPRTGTRQNFREAGNNEKSRNPQWVEEHHYIYKEMHNARANKSRFLQYWQYYYNHIEKHTSSLTHAALALNNDNDLREDNDNNLEKRPDERRQPLVGRLGQRAVRRSRRLRRMPRRVGGDAAGRETAEAVRKPRQVCGLPQRSGGCLQSCPTGADKQGR